MSVLGHDRAATARATLETRLEHELESIRSNVREGRKETSLRQLRERGIAAELIRDQYSGRYPFELLQNANDAAVTRHGEGARSLSVRFVLTDSALVVADMGSGFGPEEVEALCTLGDSSKDPRKTIGYKGIGFKSVGEITDRPQILSAGVSFSFDSARVRQLVESDVGTLDPDQRLPVYAFPFPIERDELGADAGLVADLEGEGFTTVKTRASR